MKKLQYVLAAALFVGSTSVAVAQDAPARQQGAGQNQMALLMKDITLTPAQQPKVDSITKKLGEDRAALRQDTNLDREGRMAKQREMSTKAYDAIKALLTDDQKKVFEKNQADLQARMQQGGGRPPQA